MIWVWLPITILYYAVHSFISFKINTTEHIKWIVIGYIIGFIPLWLWISKISTNLLRDGLIFDTALVVVCALTYAILGYGKAFTWVQWLGTAIAILGFILIQVGGVK